MNAKQWVWVCEQIKQFVTQHSGKIPDDITASDWMNLYERIMKNTERSREENQEINNDITGVLRIVFLWIHSLEVEGKTL